MSIFVFGKNDGVQTKKVNVSKEDRVKVIETYFGEIGGIDKSMSEDDFHWGLEWVFSKRVSDLLRNNKQRKVSEIRKEFEELDGRRSLCGMDYSKLKNGEKPFSKKKIEELLKVCWYLEDE